MKKLNLLVALLAITGCSFAQTAMKEHQAGHAFTVSLPDYMSKTAGLNSSSAIQYKSEVKDVYGFIIFDTKEELTLADFNFASVKEFYDNFMEDFLIDQENRKVSEAVAQSKGGINFMECDFTYYDKDAEMEIYYLIGIVETKKSFYKVLSWSAAEKKDKFKADFQKILYSVKD